MAKRKILISINTSWNIFNFRRTLLKHLADSGFQIITAAPRDKYSDKLVELGFEFYDLPIQKKGTNPFADYALFRSYRSLLREIKPDICLFYTIKPNIYGTLAAGELGIPVINNISGLGTVFLRHGFSSMIAKALYRLALKKSNFVFFQNSDDKFEFVKRGLITEQKATVIPGSGIDTDYFKPGSSGSHTNRIIFLMISRLIFDKGIMEYLNAAKEVRKKYENVEFRIIGRAEKEANLGLSEEQIKTFVKEGIITWIDEQEDIRDHITEADVIVLPSYREGLSRALLEACSMAKPIITTDVPGCRELVDENKNGFLCEARNAENLAGTIEKAISKSREELNKMGLHGRDLAKMKYEQSLIFEAYRNAIANYLK